MKEMLIGVILISCSLIFSAQKNVGKMKKPILI